MPTLDARIEFVSQRERFDIQEDADVQTAHKLAREVTVETLLDNEAEAAAENARQFGLTSIKRDIYEVAVDRGLIEDKDIEVGDTVTLDLSRPIGLKGGKDFIFLGYTVDPKKDMMNMILWG